MQGEMQGQEEEEVVLRGSKCQDCGNQAKKECSYSRCRTCCKNKGFHCPTHIKSTWTPVDRRRHKKTLQGDIIPQNLTQINPYSGSSGIEFKFPAATNSMAVFRCVQVRSMDEEVNEIAYQTCVNIGGHVFSGLLYDQGPADQSNNNNNSDRGVSSMGLVDQQQNIGLMNINSSINSRDRSGATASASMAPAGDEDPVLTPPPYPFQLRPAMPYLRYPRS